MLERTIYICGVHATGKSTIIDDLSKFDFAISHPRSGHSKSNVFLEKLKYRIEIYYKDALEQVEYEITYKNKLILADRSIYDGLSYVDTFYKLNWIDQKGLDECYSLFHSLFNENILPSNLIFVNPSINWNINRMHERWKIEGKRWREEEPDFIPTAHECFEKKYKTIPVQNSDVNFLEINEINRKKRTTQIIEFLKSSSLLNENTGHNILYK